MSFLSNSGRMDITMWSTLTRIAQALRADTQSEAINKAKAIDPNATIHVDRVRDIGLGHDKWRKI
jgi:hypothetical protein